VVIRTPGKQKGSSTTAERSDAGDPDGVSAQRE